jgi:hypothetical protein
MSERQLRAIDGSADLLCVEAGDPEPEHSVADAAIAEHDIVTRTN